jgi:hypothetical protein
VSNVLRGGRDAQGDREAEGSAKEEGAEDDQAASEGHAGCETIRLLLTVVEGSGDAHDLRVQHQYFSGARDSVSYLVWEQPLAVREEDGCHA